MLEVKLYPDRLLLVIRRKSEGVKRRLRDGEKK